MEKNRKMILFVTLVLMGCCITPLFTVAQCNAESDWTSLSGDVSNPYISDAESPMYENQLDIKWARAGEIATGGGMDDKWVVPSTAISVGNHAYYYDGFSKQLRKVHIDNGEVDISASLTVNGMYDVPLTYGNGKLFVPTLSASAITVKIYNADTLALIGNTDTPISKAQGMQGPVTYYDGHIYFGTYGKDASGVDFACFDENGTYVWGIDGGSWGHVMIPQFVTSGEKTYCIMASKGFGSGVTDGGSTVYIVDSKTGVIYDSVKINGEYTMGGLTYYEGRVYVATQNKDVKVTRIHSYDMGADGKLSGEKIWTSNGIGGTQSVPVIYNDRIYLGGGGETMGSARGIDVIRIDSDGSMTTAYSIPIQTKSTLTLTTAYATVQNDHTVYLYCIPYNGLGANPDMYIIEDSANQAVAKYRAIELDGNGDEYSYHSVAITSQGYLLIKNDATLWCCQAKVQEFIVGDINCNGTINVSDYVMLQQYLANMMKLSETQLTNADTTDNDVINVQDSVLLAKYLAQQDVHLGP